MTQIDVTYLPVWNRYLELFREGALDNEALGALFRAMMEYQFEGTEPEDLSGTAKVYWLFIRKDLDHARQKYEASVNNGKKGGRKKKKKEPDETQLTLTEGKTITESISESITESKSESESISITKKEHSTFPSGGENLSGDKKPYGEFGWIMLTEDQYRALEQEMGQQELMRCMTYIDESAQSTNNRNHWTDWYLVLRRCHQQRWHERRSYGNPKQEIPMGASGHLGEAELEAIQRVLQS